MTVHLVKLSVGSEGVDTLKAWVDKKSAANEKAGLGRVHDHVTRMHPRRESELLDGGSIYWVIKGVIQARQKLIGFEKRVGADGIERCAILIETPLILTEPQPRRAFQGWRYLPVEDAPADLNMRSRRGQRQGPPPELSLELAELGLL